MNWLAMAIGTITRIPFEKFLVKRKSPEEQLDRLTEALTRNQVPPAVKTAQAVAASAPAVISTDETIAYQRREIGKELLLLEKHLQQRCKIAGKACDCCEKHPIAIEALAQEALGITGETVFSDVVKYAQELSPITTVLASASGNHDEEYPQLAVKARLLRKSLMGTEEIKALLSPEQIEAVEANVQKIMSNEGGNNGGEGQDAV